ncbi:MAG: hypothetical protein VX642_04065 [Bdellovibrionota bacterium]|nr:hypothetical protein [Bdellovibrionota bacterium]
MNVFKRSSVLLISTVMVSIPSWAILDGSGPYTSCAKTAAVDADTKGLDRLITPEKKQEIIESVQSGRVQEEAEIRKEIEFLLAELENEGAILTPANRYDYDEVRIATNLSQSPFLQGTMGGTFTGEHMKTVENGLNSLRAEVSKFAPANYDPNSMSRFQKLRQRVTGTSPMVKFETRKDFISNILQGLNRARVSLLFDNQGLDVEIQGIYIRLKAIENELQAWGTREQIINEVIKEKNLKLESLNSEGQERTKEARALNRELHLLNSEVRFAVQRTLKMYEQQYDILEGVIIAHRNQQEQNSMTIESIVGIVRTAELVIPSMVTMAETASNNVRSQNLADQTRSMMETGLNSVLQQQRANRKRNEESLAKGVVSDQSIMDFRTGMLKEVEEYNKAKERIANEIEAGRQQRAIAIEEQKLFVDAVIQRDKIEEQLELNRLSDSQKSEQQD